MHIWGGRQANSPASSPQQSGVPAGQQRVAVPDVVATVPAGQQPLRPNARERGQQRREMTSARPSALARPAPVTVWQTCVEVQHSLPQHCSPVLQHVSPQHLSSASQQWSPQHF
jgi:hypothetical protein